MTNIQALTNAIAAINRQIKDTNKLTYIYIAGPYTNGNQNRNVLNAILAAEELYSIGYIPIVPHLSHLWDMMRPHQWDFWINLDLCLLRLADAVLRLPGHSAGADRETAFAAELGIPIFTSIPNLIEYYHDAKTSN